MMQESAVLSALQKGVTAAVAASIRPALPIAYLDKAFTIPADKIYLEIVWIPNNPTNSFWGNQKNYQGMLRLVLHWPKDDTDPYRKLDLLASISAYFTKGRLLSGVQIYETPAMTGSPIAQEGELLYPVSLRYQSYRSS